MKLFVSWDGSDPEYYEGSSLCECLGDMLSCRDLDDDNVQYVLEDMQHFAERPADEEGRIKLRFITSVECTAEWCYGYDSFWDAFEEYKEPCISCGDNMYPLHYNRRCPTCFNRESEK